jgi:hypothetical protein
MTSLNHLIEHFPDAVLKFGILPVQSVFSFEAYNGIFRNLYSTYNSARYSIKYFEAKQLIYRETDYRTRFIAKKSVSVNGFSYIPNTILTQNNICVFESSKSKAYCYIKKKEGSSTVLQLVESGNEVIVSETNESGVHPVLIRNFDDHQDYFQFPIFCKLFLIQ